MTQSSQVLSMQRPLPVRGSILQGLLSHLHRGPGPLQAGCEAEVTFQQDLDPAAKPTSSVRAASHILPIGLAWDPL